MSRPSAPRTPPWPGNPIRAGSPTTDGWERIEQTLQAATRIRPEHLNLAWIHDTSKPIPQTDLTSYFPLANLEETAGTSVVFKIRARPMTAALSTAGEQARWRIFYRFTGGASAKLRIHTGATASPAGSADLSSSTWA